MDAVVVVRKEEEENFFFIYLFFFFLYWTVRALRTNRSNSKKDGKEGGGLEVEVGGGEGSKLSIFLSEEDLKTTSVVRRVAKERKKER